MTVKKFNYTNAALSLFQPQWDTRAIYVRCSRPRLSPKLATNGLAMVINSIKIVARIERTSS